VAASSTSTTSTTTTTTTTTTTVAPPTPTSEETTTPTTAPTKTTPPDHRASHETLDDVKALLQSLPFEYDYEVVFQGSDDSDSGDVDDASAAASRPEFTATIEGQLPSALKGTFIRNGPGLLVDTPGKYGHRHAFDGDGVAVRLSFSGGDNPRLRFKNSFVRTRAFVEEQAAGRPLYRSSFTRGGVGGPGSAYNPFDLSVKNTANTSFVWWAGKLAALFEAGLAHVLDPATLDTLQRDTPVFEGGGDRNQQPAAAIDTPTLGAHYRVCSFTGRLVMFSVGPSFPEARATFFELDSFGKRVHKTSARLPGTFVPLVHDFSVTENYYVLVEGPVKLSARGFFWEYPRGEKAIAETLEFDDSKRARVLLIPRPGGRFAGRAPRVFEAPSAFFAFHLANAYELPRAEVSSEARRRFYGGGAGGEANSERAENDHQDDEPIVVVDCVAWDKLNFSSFNYSVLDGDPQPVDPSYYEGGARTHLVRLVVDARRPTVRGGGGAGTAITGAVTAHRLLRRTCEFPQVDPTQVGRPHSAVFLGADALDDDVHWLPLNAVVRLDVDPLFAAAQSYAEGRGWWRPPVGSSVATPLEWRLDEGGGGGVEEVPGRLGLQVWDAGTRVLMLEQVFVPSRVAAAGKEEEEEQEEERREGEGFLVGTAYDAEKRRGMVLVFDAERASDGPLAKITLGHHLPSGLHGVWVPEKMFGAFGGGGDGDGEAKAAAATVSSIRTY
jgi:all-trans-8'-apo-beta-carotenal 15,15'-oxygenase